MPSTETTRLCVVHACERQGEHKRVLHLGGEQVVAGFCEPHVPAGALEPPAGADHDVPPALEDPAPTG